MSKFCSNCGKEMPDYAVICGECGTPFEKAEKPEDLKGKVTGFASKLNLTGDKNKLIKLGGGVLALLLVLILIISSIVSAGPEAIAKKLVKKSLNGHYTDIYDYYWISLKKELSQHAEYWDVDLDEYLDEVYDVSSVKEYCEKMDEERADYLEDQYGDFKYKITKVKIDMLDEDELDDFKENDLEGRFESYEDVCNYDPDDVKKACEFTVKVKLTDEDDDTEKLTFSGKMIKLKGKWRVLYFG